MLQHCLWLRDKMPDHQYRRDPLNDLYVQSLAHYVSVALPAWLDLRTTYWQRLYSLRIRANKLGRQRRWLPLWCMAALQRERIQACYNEIGKIRILGTPILKGFNHQANAAAFRIHSQEIADALAAGGLIDTFFIGSSTFFPIGVEHCLDSELVRANTALGVRLEKLKAKHKHFHNAVILASNADHSESRHVELKKDASHALLLQYRVDMIRYHSLAESLFGGISTLRREVLSMALDLLALGERLTENNQLRDLVAGNVMIAAETIDFLGQSLAEARRRLDQPGYKLVEGQLATAFQTGEIPLLYKPLAEAS